MVIINDIYTFLNEIAPVRYQMDFDNAGFLVGDGGAVVKKALLALDITDAVIAEAIELRAQLIVSHHPLIFTPLRHATTDDLAGRKVLTMARHGISAICMHTNLDIADGGVNDALMATLGAEVTGGLEAGATRQIVCTFLRQYVTIGIGRRSFSYRQARAADSAAGRCSCRCSKYRK